MAPTVANCAFCAIIRGETPAVRVLETGSLLAFLDHRPLFLGHTLLVPKDHIQRGSDLSSDSYAVRVVLLAEAVATMPWLVTLTDLTDEPGGQLRDGDGDRVAGPAAAEQRGEAAETSRA